MPNMKVVLFLGAGFSAEFGHPVMNDFFAFADRSSRLSSEDKAFLGTLLLESRRANSFLQSSPTNLEDILSFAGMADRLGLSTSQPPREEQVRRILQTVYTDYPEDSDYWSRYDVFSSFIGEELRSYQGDYSIITTNYDINIESALHRMNIRPCPGFDLLEPGANSGHSTHSMYSERGLSLFKLHGSVNWYTAGQGSAISAVGHMIREVVPAAGQTVITVPLVCSRNSPSPSPPVIVPPSFLKPSLTPELVQVWSGAAASLRQANLLVFVGYSFPASDTEMSYFLASALAENSGLRSIWIVDPMANAIVDRLRSVGSKYGSHFQGLLHPMNACWNETVLAPQELAVKHL